MDAIDLDFCDGVVAGWTIEDVGGDGLDLSGSTLTLVDNRIARTGDKGVSVGDISRPDELVEGMQLERVVKKAIAQLEPDFREVLVLRDVEDLSYEEIAAITGLPDGTVKSRIHRARGQLRALVEKVIGEKVRSDK